MCCGCGSVAAYGVGLVVTFVALALMATGQPALLYLVPLTLLTTLFVALRRGELSHMWHGHLPVSRTPQLGGATKLTHLA